jgi:hypothetical protein
VWIKGHQFLQTLAVYQNLYTFLWSVKTKVEPFSKSLEIQKYQQQLTDWISEIQKANAQLAWSMAALTTHDKFILPKTVEQVACRYYLFVCSLGTNSWINDSVSFQYWQKDIAWIFSARSPIFMHQYRLTNEQCIDWLMNIYISI